MGHYIDVPWDHLWITYCFMISSWIVPKKKKETKNTETNALDAKNKTMSDIRFVNNKTILLNYYIK